MNLMNHKWKITGIFIILLIVFCCIPFHASEFVLEIRYTADDVKQGVSQLFWSTQQSGYNSEKQVTSVINGSKARLDITSSVLEATEYRLDFINKEQKFGITSIMLYLDGKVKWKLSGKEILKYIQRMENVTSCYINENDAIFEVSGDDPIVILNPAFTNKIKAGVEERSYGKSILGIILLFGIYISLMCYRPIGDKSEFDYDKNLTNRGVEKV